MPSTFYAFVREGGHRTFAAPADGTPYVELTGPAALLLTVCPALAIAFGADLLIPYAVFWQLFRLVLVGSPRLLLRSFSKTILHAGGPVSVILDTRAAHPLPGWDWVARKAAGVPESSSSEVLSM